MQCFDGPSFTSLPTNGPFEADIRRVIDNNIRISTIDLKVVQ